MLRWLQNPFKFLSSSISKKIIIPYAVLTLVLATLGVFVVVRLVAGSFEARLKNQLREAAQIVADEVVNRERLRLEIERVVANTIGVSEAMVDRNTDQLEELVAPVIANARIIDSIILVDTQGKELLRLQREGLGPNVFVSAQVDSELDLYGWAAVQQVLSDPEGDKSVQLVRDSELNELIIYTVGPVRDARGNAVGAVLVGTYLATELAILQNLALAQLTLFDDTGRVMETTFVLNEDEADPFKFFTPARYRQVTSQQEVTLLDQTTLSEQDEASGVVTIRDQGYRLAYAPFRLRNEIYGVYAVALPTNFITDATDQSRNVMIALFSVGVVTVFGIGYFVSRRISQPIMQLVRTSQAIAGGDLDQRTGLQREDEIGVLAATFDDMTGELQRLLELQEEEASRLNAILTSIADGVIVQNLKDDVAIVNPAAVEILEVIKYNWDQALQLGENSGAAVTGAQLTGNASVQDYLDSLKYGENKRFQVGNKMLSAISAPVVSTEGERLGTVVILRDVTREYESERLKDDFITSVSHELRTPLTAIKGYNDLLRLTASPQLDEQQLGFVDTIDRNIDDLLEIIQQMLDLSEMDAGELGIDESHVDYLNLVAAETDQWLPKMEERQIDFSVELPSESIWILGDQNRLTRVIHNLIKNAWQYTLPGGKVAVVIHGNGVQVQTDISDTGVGIAPADQRHLFTRFVRAIHAEHTFELSGAGLGLYTSRAIIEAHGGKLWMESQLNKGSTFSFTLPLSESNLDGKS